VRVACSPCSQIRKCMMIHAITRVCGLDLAPAVPPCISNFYNTTSTGNEAKYLQSEYYILLL
jgi:hypothetical protein